MRIALWLDNGDWYYDDAEDHGFGPNLPVGGFLTEAAAKADALALFNPSKSVVWEDGPPLHYILYNPHEAESIETMIERETGQ
jgi:hypothetical protein